MTLPHGSTRRRFLGLGVALSGVGAAGCLDLGGTSKGATDVVLHNESMAPVMVTLEITDADASEPRLAATVRLEPGGRATPTQDDKLPVGGDYVVDIGVEGGLTERYRWSDVTLDLAPLHVLVDGSSNIVFALEVG